MPLKGGGTSISENESPTQSRSESSRPQWDLGTLPPNRNTTLLELRKLSCWVGVLSHKYARLKSRVQMPRSLLKPEYYVTVSNSCAPTESWETKVESADAPRPLHWCMVKKRWPQAGRQVRTNTQGACSPHSLRGIRSTHVPVHSCSVVWRKFIDSYTNSET